MCVSLGCPAISWNPVEREEELLTDGKKRLGYSSIDATLCPGCGLCIQVCKFNAIHPTGDKVVFGFETKGR